MPVAVKSKSTNGPVVANHKIPTAPLLDKHVFIVPVRECFQRSLCYAIQQCHNVRGLVGVHRKNLTAQIPVLIGEMQDSGTLFAGGRTNLMQFLTKTLAAGNSVDFLRSLYLGQNNSRIIPSVIKGIKFPLVIVVTSVVASPCCFLALSWGV